MYKIAHQYSILFCYTVVLFVQFFMYGQGNFSICDSKFREIDCVTTQVSEREPFLRWYLMGIGIFL